MPNLSCRVKEALALSNARHLEAVKEELLGVTLVGNNAATALTSAIQSIRKSNAGFFPGVISLLMLFIGASTVFAQLQAVLNRIWGVQPKPGHFWSDLFRQRLFSFAMVIGVSFVFLVSLILSAILAMITDYFSYLLPGATVLWQMLDIGLSFSVITALFALIFKVVPDVEVQWRDVWFGALITSILFVGGKTVIAYCLLSRPERCGIGIRGNRIPAGVIGMGLLLLANTVFRGRVHQAPRRRTWVASQTCPRCRDSLTSGKAACAGRETSSAR